MNFVQAVKMNFVWAVKMNFVWAVKMNFVWVDEDELRLGLGRVGRTRPPYSHRHLRLHAQR